MLTLGRYYAERFRANILTVESIAKYTSIRECLVCTYEVMTARGMITKIEDLAEEDKRELWQEATARELDRDDRVKFCKALYTLNNLL